MRLLCDVLQVARSAYYDWVQGGVSERERGDALLKVHIKGIHRRSRGTYGSPRVHAELLDEGHRVGRKRVARLMAGLALSGVPERRFKGTTTDSDHDDRIAENLTVGELGGPWQHGRPPSMDTRAPSHQEGCHVLGIGPQDPTLYSSG